MNIGAYLYIIRGKEYNFPYTECVRSILPLCNGVHVLVDPRFADSEQVISDLENVSQEIIVHKEEINLNDPGVDGATKARVRELASQGSYDWLLQMDADEVFRAEDILKVDAILRDTESDLICCGVLNWFNGNHLKITSPCSKERFSRNVPYITHGIPVQYRTERKDGFSFVDEMDWDMTDGAGYIDKGGNSLSGDVTTFSGMSKVIDFSKDNKSYANYEFIQSLKEHIWVHHYSWYSLPRRWQREKVWNYFWGVLRGKYWSLEDFENADGKHIDFFKVSKMRKPMSYHESITNEMLDRSLFKVDWINHPRVMSGWLKDNERYVYGRKQQELCKPKLSLKRLFKEKILFKKEEVVFD